MLTGGLEAGQAGGAPAAGNARAFYVTPTLSAKAEVTNNLKLSATDKVSDLILTISPGLSLGGQSGRVKGFLDYRLDAIFYARNQQSSSFQNYLNARVNAEAVENWLFVDASASISQQYISPFGSQSTDNSLVNSNRTEVSTVNIAPYIRGQIAGNINYLGRVFYDFTSSGTSQAGDSQFWGGVLRLDSTTRWSRLSWSLDLTYREGHFEDRRNVFDQLNILSLNYAITPYLKVSARGNTEDSNISTFEAQKTNGWGWGLQWSPSPRTNLSLVQDQRFFGSSHVYSFDYRTPRTVWSISSTQGLSTGQNIGGRGTAGSPYDLLFAQFATIEPDPVARAQLVNNFLKSNGINPSASLNPGYLPSQVVEEERQQASVAMLGDRSTLVFNAYQTYSRNLNPLTNPDSNFANGNVLHWLGFGVNWAHRLTPTSSLNLGVTQQQTDESVGQQATNLRSVNAMWSTKLARRATASLNARYQSFSGTTNSYNEAALFATLSMTF